MKIKRDDEMYWTYTKAMKWRSSSGDEGAYDNFLKTVNGADPTIRKYVLRKGAFHSAVLFELSLEML